MEKILSLHIGHDATAMFIDERDLISIAEERVSRIKKEKKRPASTTAPSATGSTMLGLS